MATNFSSLRANRKNALDKLNDEIKKQTQKQGADERFWKLSVDQKTKVGYARLRFLPAPKNEDVPWVRLFAHAFKVGGAWMIDNCPTTLGQRPCPVCKDNNKLWNSGNEADKSIARDRKRKLQFISNVLVLEDPAKPENVGKVFLFKYGAKIHDKIQESVNPTYPGDVPVNPFDLWEGADFKLKSQNVGGFQNYDKSEFADKSALFGGDDAKLEAIYEQEHSLQAFVAEDQFKSYEELEKRFDKVTTGEDAPRSAADAIRAEQPTREDAQEAAEATVKATRKPRAAVKTTVVTPPAPAEDVPEDEDDIKDFFADVLK